MGEGATIRERQVREFWGVLDPDCAGGDKNLYIWFYSYIHTCTRYRSSQGYEEVCLRITVTGHSLLPVGMCEGEGVSPSCSCAPRKPLQLCVTM